MKIWGIIYSHSKYQIKNVWCIETWKNCNVKKNKLNDCFEVLLCNDFKSYKNIFGKTFINLKKKQVLNIYKKINIKYLQYYSDEINYSTENKNKNIMQKHIYATTYRYI